MENTTLSTLNRLTTDSDNRSTANGTEESYYYYYYREEWLSQTYGTMFEVMPVITVILSIVGNILSLIVLSRKAFQNLSVSIYLRGLAIADVCASLSSVSFWVFLEGKNLKFGYRDFTPWACKFHMYIHSTFPVISAWLVVAISIERVIVVSFPLKAKEICTKVKAKVITVIIFVSVLVSQIHAPLMFNLDRGWCDTTNSVYYESMVIISIIFMSIVPPLMIIVCNVAIIVTMVKMARIKSAMSQSSSQNNTNLNVMLVVNCVFSLVLYVPYNTLVAIIHFTGHFDSITFFIADIFYEMAIFNHAINFILYVICGSAFRKELILVFKCVPSKTSRIKKSPIREHARADNARY